MRERRKFFSFTILAVLISVLSPLPEARANGFGSSTTLASFGTIRGTVRDQRGVPIAGAVVALLREASSTVRQVRSTGDGSFAARVLPGRYSLTAMADGYSVVSLSNVEIDRAGDIALRFNLIRTGSGNTLPERRADRNNAKYRQRANQTRRSIYQNNEGTNATVAETEELTGGEEIAEERSAQSRPGQSTVETYFANSADGGSYLGTNFATVKPVNENLELVFAGQTGIGENAPQRLETSARLKLNEQHRVSLNFGGAMLGKVQTEETVDEEDLGQISFQALDEWRVKDGIILVFGVDYSRFVGASDADSINPRLGLQFDVDAKTRFSAAYTVQNEPRTWQQAAELEDSRVLFSQPSLDSYAVIDKQVLMPRLRRLEFGIERVLDNSSSLEATAFFDATTNRGVSFISLPINTFESTAGEDDFSTAIQSGSAQGVRVVYSRRLNSIFGTSLGYAAGRGQRLSSEGIENPANLFEDAVFQTLAAQLSANFDSGTEVRTVWRFSPRATVFAIDPFAGRMAFYDPSLSVVVTQKLPSLGLPLRAKAIIDARNLFDFQTATTSGENSLQLNQSRRVLRGGIAVRF